MENINTLTLGEIVSRDHRAAKVLESFGLDYCCAGNQRFDEACESLQVDKDEVVHALNKLHSADEEKTNYDQWSLDFLADYIYNRHHRYIEEKTPLIEAHLEKLCAVHGHFHPELLEIKRIFSETSATLAVHMKKEELMIFPYIRNLVKAKTTGKPATSHVFKSVAGPILSMKSDHIDEGEQLHLMSVLSNNFTPPSGVCNTYVVTYELLKEYERDMHMHIHLENNILFSKAILLEEELIKKDLIR